jgi:type IV pilus assembly protein PilY1
VSCSGAATGYTNCYNPSTCTGLSSYYALDITDVENPKLLWEFSHPLLGYTYSGPAVITKWTNASNMSGNQYYVMFLSGPTDAADGSSIQDVQAFVLWLNSNLSIKSVYYNDFGSTTKNGFGGRLFTNGLQVNGDTYTDYVLFGYAAAPNGKTGSWTGGIGVVNTNNKNPSLAMDPSNWTYDISTFSHIPQLPITARVATMQCFNAPGLSDDSSLSGAPLNYLFAGTGRYFFPLDNYGSTNNSGLNYLMGVPFTCDQYFQNCGTPSLNTLTQSTDDCSALQQATNVSQLSSAGWQYNLDPAAADGSYLAERMVTDPTVTAPGLNKVYFVTTEPTSDPCGYGGHSRVWGFNCATGGPINDASCPNYQVNDSGTNAGTIYLQTSTGAIYQIQDASSFTVTSTGGRATNWFQGIPPETSPPVVQGPTPTTRGGQLIQWIEK